MTGGASTQREAFSLLAHEIRLDILLALLADWHADRTEPQSYSELMSAVGIDDSGKFNYHLEQLRGTYLRKVEDGYVPLASATALYRAVLGNRPTEPVERTEFRLADPCPHCSHPLTASYDKEFLSVACSACDSPDCRFTYPLPKNGLAGRDDEAVVRAVHQRAKHHVGLARTGQCPFCAGRTTPEIQVETLGSQNGFEVEITCDTCTFLIQADLLFSVLLDSRVAAALVELGVPVETAYKWQLPESTSRIRSRDPLRVAVDIEVDGQTATVVLDDTLTVERVTVDERSSSPAAPDSESG